MASRYTDKEIKALLIRHETSDVGTFGTMVFSDFKCFTAELPWRDNRTGLSCIPTGTYDCEYWSSQKYKKAYHLINVPDRSAILIHQGNWAGDTTKGLKSNVLGCILVGAKLGIISGQKGVLSSKVTLDNLINKIGQNKFILTIEEQYDY